MRAGGWGEGHLLGTAHARAVHGCLRTLASQSAPACVVERGGAWRSVAERGACLGLTSEREDTSRTQVNYRRSMRRVLRDGREQQIGDSAREK